MTESEIGKLLDRARELARPVFKLTEALPKPGGCIWEFDIQRLQAFHLTCGSTTLGYTYKSAAGQWVAVVFADDRIKAERKHFSTLIGAAVWISDEAAAITGLEKESGE